MKLKRGIYNIIFNLVSQFITLGLGIIIPRLFLVNLGSELNGLVSSIGQVYVYVGLLEAGIGLSAQQALYKPIIENNIYDINSILSAADRYYKKMGKFYILSVFIFAFIYPLFIKTSVDTFTVIIVIILSGMAGAINFFLQNKYTILLNAEGKNYIMTNINMGLSLLISIAKIVLLMHGFNIIAIQLSQFIITLCRIVILNLYMKKKYNWIDLNVKPNYECLSQRNSVLIHQIAYMIFSNTDVLILTIFCNLKVVSVYVIYNMLLGVIEGVISTVNNGVTFLFGQLYNEDKNKFISFFDVYELVYMIISFSAFIVVYQFAMPFLELYTLGITDINYIDNKLLILFICLKLLVCMRAQCFTTINVVGCFKSTQNSAIIEAIINLGSSLILVNIYGIYGVVMGSIIGLIYRSLYCIIYTNKNILNRTPLITLKKWLLNVVIFIFAIYVLQFINLSYDSYIQIIVTAGLNYIIILTCVFSLNMMFNRKVFIEIISFIKNKLYNREKLESKYQV